MSEQQQLNDEQKQKVLEMEVTAKVLVIAQMCKVIEGCTQRGAFKAEELSYIGGLYDSFSKIIKECTDKVKAESEESSVTVMEPVIEGVEE